MPDSIVCWLVQALADLEARVITLEEGDNCKPVSHGIEIALLKLGASVAASEARREGKTPA